MHDIGEVASLNIGERFDCKTSIRFPILIYLMHYGESPALRCPSPCFMLYTRHRFSQWWKDGYSGRRCSRAYPCKRSICVWPTQYTKDAIQ